MANELKIFESQDFGKVRVVERDDELLFCARDVLEALGYSQTMIANMKHCLNHVPDQWKTQHPMLTPGGRKDLVFLKEQGLYFFLSRSDKPKALPYQMWLAGDVVPSIRKNGAYIAGQEQMTDAELVAKALIAANNIIAEREKRIADMTAKIEEQSAAMTVMRPKAKYCDDVLQSKSLLNVETIAKEFGKTARWLNQYLHDKGIQFRRGKNAPWTLYQEYAGKGYARYDTYTDTRYRFSSENLKWTQEGRKFIHELLAQDGFEVVCSHE